MTFKKNVIPGRAKRGKGDPGGQAPSVHQYLDPLSSRYALAGDEKKDGKL